jgi:hypothetical protein
MKRISIGAAGLVIGLVVALTLPSFAAASVMSAKAGAASPTPPRILAKPHNVMVNTKITLLGRHFPAHTRLKIAECSNANWVVVAQKPCDGANAIWVRTDRHGRFVSPFTVKLCPRSKSGSNHGTEETCYIGNPEPRGVDTITLVGAARITVTYP